MTDVRSFQQMSALICTNIYLHVYKPYLINMSAVKYYKLFRGIFKHNLTKKIKKQLLEISGTHCHVLPLMA